MGRQSSTKMLYAVGLQEIEEEALPTFSLNENPAFDKDEAGPSRPSIAGSQKDSSDAPAMPGKC